MPTAALRPFGKPLMAPANSCRRYHHSKRERAGHIDAYRIYPLCGVQLGDCQQPKWHSDHDLNHRRVLGTLRDPHANCRRCDGRRQADLRAGLRSANGRNCVGESRRPYLPQRITLFDGTIAENIARLDGQPHSTMIVEAARKADAQDMLVRLPQGYDTRVSAAGGRLSGGRMQRIGLARALYGDPVLLILDEPNSNLDNSGSMALNTAIRTMKAEGKSVLIMAHRPAAIQECDPDPDCAPGDRTRRAERASGKGFDPGPAGIGHRTRTARGQGARG